MIKYFRTNVRLTLRTSRFPRDSHERIARFHQAFGSQLMINFETGSESGTNTTIQCSPKFSYVLSASATLTCGCCHSTDHPGQAAWCLVARWAASRAPISFISFCIIYYRFICLSACKGIVITNKQLNKYKFNKWINELLLSRFPSYYVVIQSYNVTGCWLSIVYIASPICVNITVNNFNIIILPIT